MEFREIIAKHLGLGIKDVKPDTLIPAAKTGAILRDVSVEGKAVSGVDLKIGRLNLPGDTTVALLANCVTGLALAQAIFTRA